MRGHFFSLGAGILLWATLHETHAEILGNVSTIANNSFCAPYGAAINTEASIAAIVRLKWLVRYDTVQHSALPPSPSRQSDTCAKQLRLLNISSGNVTALANGTFAGVAVDAALTFVLFVSCLPCVRDPSSCRIPPASPFSKTDPVNKLIELANLTDGSVTVIAGGARGSADGYGTAATFSLPGGVALTAVGSVAIVAGMLRGAASTM